MAPSSGTLIPKAFKVFEFAVSKTGAFIRSRLSKITTPEAIPIRIPARQPLHPLAALRQTRSSSQHRFFSTAVRRFALLSKSPAPNPVSAARSYPASATRTLLSKSTLAPFSSPLRPNLTGGALPRTAGGYCLGGRTATRQFSHVPAAQAQLVQNVSAAVRAFCVQGFRPHYEGVDPKTGQARFGVVSANTANVTRKVARVSGDNSILGRQQQHEKEDTVLGTSVIFRIMPAVTSLTTIGGSSLGQSGILGSLAADFEAHRKELAAIEKDLERLASLGPSLGVKMSSDGSTVQVRFPGCDGESVSRLCEELGVMRGLVRADEGWGDHGETEAKDVAMALLFPLAPDATSDGGDYFEPSPTIEICGASKPFGAGSLEWESMLNSKPSPIHSWQSDIGSFVLANQTPESQRSHMEPLYSDMSFHDLDGSDIASNESLGLEMPIMTSRESGCENSADYEGVEGVYRFLSQLEATEK